MEDPKEIISDEEIERVHGNANFGSMSKRDVVNQGVLKCASGYYQGSTSMAIIEKHGLINSKYELTPKGKAYLWAAFLKPTDTDAVNLCLCPKYFGDCNLCKDGKCLSDEI